MATWQRGMKSYLRNEDVEYICSDATYRVRWCNV